MSATGLPVELDHPIYGACRLLRVEGMNWVVEITRTRTQLRVPATRRNEFSQPAAQAFPSPTAEAPPRREGFFAGGMEPAPEGSRPSPPPRQAPTQTTEQTWQPPPVSAQPATTSIGSQGSSNTERHPQPSAVSASALGAVPGAAGDTQRIEITQSASSRPSLDPHQRIRLKRAIESLRNGLPPTSVEAHKLAVGLEDFERDVVRLLHRVASDGGAVRVVRGAYGQGKSLSLNLTAELALANGFWVAQTEVDASQNRLDRPNQIYRSLMQSLRIPNEDQRGVHQVATHLVAMTRTRFGVDPDCWRPYSGVVGVAEYHQRQAARERYHRDIELIRSWLERELHCPPLAWLLSDPNLPDKQLLCGLLEGDNGWSVSSARAQHIFPGAARLWPKFSAGTQGDFACFLLSGLGRLARLLGGKGLVVILDEMEKWQDLSWNQQTQAGNFVGGLIWAATAQEGQRGQKRNPHQPAALRHSLRAGGSPFTTTGRCHVGVLIALTPRGIEGPEDLWRGFGEIGTFDLPEFTQEKFRTYIAGTAAHYAAAYDLPQPDIGPIMRRAISLWRDQGDGSARTAVRAAIQALDEWRETAT